MLNVWRMVPAVSSALLVLVWSVFSLVVLESSEGRVADNLGYPGEAMRVIAVPADGYAGPERLTAALVAFTADHEISVAYSRSYGTGLVTVLDEHDRFRNGDGSLAALLGPVGSGPTAAVSNALALSPSVTPVLQRPEGLVVTGTFESDVMFEGRYPVVLFSVDALPFGEGVYLFAGNDILGEDRAFDDQMVLFFEENGMAVADVMALDAGTPQSTLLSSLRTPYGAVVLMFGGIVALTQLVVLQISAALFRDRSFVAAVLGAARRRVGTIVLQRLLRQVVTGSAMGAVLSMVVVLSIEDLSLVEPRTRIAVVPVALVVSLVTSIVMCWCVAWREARRVARVVPS